jgi:hypothetical protein
MSDLSPENLAFLKLIGQDYVEPTEPTRYSLDVDTPTAAPVAAPAPKAAPTPSPVADTTPATDSTEGAK